jgi:hypothetical protein
MKATKNDETLANSIKQSTQQKGGGKERTKREDPSLSQKSKTQRESEREQRNKCFKRKSLTGFGILCVFSASTPIVRNTIGANKPD